MYKKLFIGLILAVVLFTPVVSLADDYGLDKTAGSAGLMSKTTDLPTTAGNVIGTALSLVGVIFFALMIYGGFMWMTAQGAEEQSKKAMDTIIAAIIGLVIVLASYAITRFVFTSVQSDVAGDPSACIAKGTEWSCKSIDSCGLTFTAGADLSAKRSVCSGSANTCALNLCKNMLDETVCCKN